MPPLFLQASDLPQTFCTVDDDVDVSCPTTLLLDRGEDVVSSDGAK